MLREQQLRSLPSSAAFSVPSLREKLVSPFRLRVGGILDLQPARSTRCLICPPLPSRDDAFKIVLAHEPVDV